MSNNLDELDVTFPVFIPGMTPEEKLDAILNYLQDQKRILQANAERSRT